MKISISIFSLLAFGVKSSYAAQREFLCLNPLSIHSLLVQEQESMKWIKSVTKKITFDMLNAYDYHEFLHLLWLCVTES